MRRTWILCLLIALLPLRGWAMSAMSVERLAQETAQAGQLPPCHQAMAEQGEGRAQDQPGHDGGHTCSHCAICHGVLGPLSLPALPASCVTAVGQAPAWAGHPPPARAPDLPFKPPRA